MAAGAVLDLDEFAPVVCRDDIRRNEGRLFAEKPAHLHAHICGTVLIVHEESVNFSDAPIPHCVEATVSPLVPACHNVFSPVYVSLPGNKFLPPARESETKNLCRTTLNSEIWLERCTPHSGPDVRGYIAARRVNRYRPRFSGAIFFVFPD
jgi:hypothetical protein